MEHIDGVDHDTSLRGSLQKNIHNRDTKTRYQMNVRQIDEASSLFLESDVSLYFIILPHRPLINTVQLSVTVNSGNRG